MYTQLLSFAISIIATVAANMVLFLAELWKGPWVRRGRHADQQEEPQRLWDSTIQWAEHNRHRPTRVQYSVDNDE